MLNIPLYSINWNRISFSLRKDSTRWTFTHPEVFGKNEVNGANQYLKNKWNQVMSLLAFFPSKLMTWRSRWMLQKSDSRSITAIFKQHAGAKCFSSMWKLLKVHTLCHSCGNVEAEGSSFSVESGSIIDSCSKHMESLYEHPIHRITTSSLFNGA